MTVASYLHSVLSCCGDALQYMTDTVFVRCEITSVRSFYSCCQITPDLSYEIITVYLFKSRNTLKLYEPLMAHLIMMFDSAFSSTASTPCPSPTLIKVCGKLYKMKWLAILLLTTGVTVEQKSYFPIKKTLHVLTAS